MTPMGMPGGKKIPIIKNRKKSKKAKGILILRGYFEKQFFTPTILKFIKQFGLKSKTMV